MSLVRLPRMTEPEIEELVKEQLICRIAFGGKEQPYIAPFQYALIDGNLYFHFTDYGRKMSLLEQNEPVCVEIESYQQDMSEFRFVVFSGKLKTVTDPEERAKAIERLAEQGRQKLSKNFLTAHGFKKENGWSSLNPNQPITIVKLDKVFEKTGLKSP